jgi:PAT family beta-lactamase induction signal transducer AmpG
VLAAGFAGLAFTDPRVAIGQFAAIAFVTALASATQDIAIDAWRIDIADETTTIDVLSAINQFGFRTASIVGGAGALLLAARLPWPAVFGVMAALMALLIVATLLAPDTPRLARDAAEAEIGQPGELSARTRASLLLVVAAAWGWAIGTVIAFAFRMLAPVAPGGKPPSVADFTRGYGPLIIVATVFVPLVVAALANALKARGRGVATVAEGAPTALRAAANHAWSALVAPLAELSGRLGWGVLTLIGFILSYALCYNIWASFAYPFYLDFMHYTKDEVAFASKIFGIFMTMVGISLAGVLLSRIGRFPTVMIGAVLPALGNLLYADLAEGGAMLDAVAHLLLLDRLGVAPRMMRLLMAICYENIATGLALTAYVAYVSSVVSRRYTAIQYALLSSLVSLVGTLGRGVTGEAFDRFGYAPVFRWTALSALVGVAFVAMEWVRNSRAVKT